MSWYKQGVHYYKGYEFRILDILRVKYTITFLCNLMNGNRSGYYKW